MINKGTTPEVNVKAHLAKFNANVTAIYPGPKPLPYPPTTPHQSSGILDNIETITEPPINKGVPGVSHEQRKWVRRSKSKAITYLLSVRLSNYLKDIEDQKGLSKEDEIKWAKRYNNSKSCCHVIEQVGEKVTTWYCKQKWCSVCARNKGMKLLNAYKDQIEKLPNLYSVTLTMKSIPGDELSYMIDRMNNVWRKIREKMHNKGMRPKGVIALEVTHGSKGYHPHFHILISGMENALIVQKEWLKHFKIEAGQGGQEVKKVKNREGFNLEMFKYAVKSVKDGVMYLPEVMHTINRATFQRKMVRAFGIVKVKIDTPRIEVSKIDWMKKMYMRYTWNSYYKDWMSKYGIEFSNRRDPEVQKAMKQKKNSR